LWAITSIWRASTIWRESAMWAVVSMHPDLAGAPRAAASVPDAASDGRLRVPGASTRRRRQALPGKICRPAAAVWRPSTPS
jgi:hypothetical protein